MWSSKILTWTKMWCDERWRCCWDVCNWNVSCCELVVIRREFQTVSGGMKNEKHNFRLMMSQTLLAGLVTSHLLALNTTGDDPVCVISITILHVSWITHVNLLRCVANQLNGVAHSIRYLPTEAAFAQQRVNGLNLIPTCNSKIELKTLPNDSSWSLTLLSGNCWKIRCRSLGSSFIKKLNTNSVNSQSPI